MRQPKRLSRTPLAILCMTGMAAGSAPMAFAQEPMGSLDELVVVGNRAPSQISEVPGTVWVLEGEELQRQFDSGQSLKDTLGKLVPGMDLGTQNRTNFGQNLRGRSVLVMIDGVSLNSSRGISRQFDSIDPFNIERIEVLSGATAIYGGGSTGGIINIITKKGDSGGPQFETEVGATSGFNNSNDRDLRGGQSISGGNEFVKGRLAVAGQDNGAFYDGNGDPILPDITQTDLQYNRTLDVMGNLQFEFSDTQSLDLTAQVYNSKFDGNKGLYLGQNLSRLNNPEIRNGFTADREPESDRYLVNASYRDTDFLGHTAYLQTSTRNEEISFHPFPGSQMRSVGASKQNTEQHTLKAMLVKELGDVELTYGMDLDREDFDANQMIFDFDQAFESGLLVNEANYTTPRYPSYRVDGTAGFLQAEWQATDRLKLDAGIRHRRASLEVGSFVPVQQRINIENGNASSAEPIPGGKNDYNITLLNAGAIYSLTNDQQIWGSFNQGNEIPDPGKVLGQGEYSLSGNGRYQLTDFLDLDSNNLPALKTNQVELGWRRHTPDWDAQIATYYTWSDKDTEITDRLTVDIVDSKTRAYGLEASGTWRLTPQWQLGGTGHYVKSETRQNGDWQDQIVTEASLPKATAHIQWGDDDTSVRFQGVHAFDIDDAQGNEIEGPTTFDLQGTQRLPAGEMTLGINNVFDKQYTTVWGQRAQLLYEPYVGTTAPFEFKGRGRTYTLSYSIKY
ncbi:TonB-dependent siderophore receptor [Halovibrio salipaludis]|uniref:Ferric aerobactin receptor n=1 Tax=Halovibrio salipaludis TaxID=2032626 RepID=A0A2A2FA57_9GAMM|nr:TonB-dependent receptor [Halovibrio salipaludis]PAU81730.1 TonB-dependent siderophore receptor [Halovibrio salipaludis]